MTNKNDRSYAQYLRGNQHIFIGDLMNSAEFKQLKNKYLPKDKVFLGIEQLLGKTIDDETNDKVRACAKEVTEVFKITEELAMKLLLGHNQMLPINMDYTPKVYSDDRYVYIRIGSKTTKADIEHSWKHIKDEQRKIGSVSSKASINSELAFCIYRQIVLNGRLINDVYADYRVRKLDGYEHPPTIDDPRDFRKYYYRVTEGLFVTQ